MKRIKPIISFEKQYLLNLIADPESCVVLQEQQYHLALHPFHLNNIKQSIKDLFGQNIARYDKKLEGILLGYENIKLLSEGTIIDDSFFIHIDVSANFFLFKPEIGKILVGIVNKKSTDHVGCLLYDTFNVSLPKPENEDLDNWSGTNIEIGNEIKFKIIFLKLQSRLPYIRGEIILSEGDETVETPKKSKRKKKKDVDISTEELIVNEDSEQTPKKKKKKKREKDTTEFDNSELSEKTERKSGKSKKQKNTANSSDYFEDVLNDILESDETDVSTSNKANLKKKKRKSKEILQNGYENASNSFENKILNETIDDMISQEFKRQRQNSLSQVEETNMKKRKRKKSRELFDDNLADVSVKSPKKKKRKNESVGSFSDHSTSQSKKKKTKLPD